MKTIFLIRHALPDFPEGRSICMGKRFDLPLGEEGRGQAEELGQQFPPLPLEAVYVSPTHRCIQTAAPLAQRLQLEPVVLEALRELDGGLWDGMTHQDVHAKYPEYFKPGNQLTPPGGESDEEAWQRGQEALQYMLAHTRRYCACVTHSSLIRVIACALLKRPFSEKRRVLADHAGILVLQWEENELTCEASTISVSELARRLAEEGGTAR